MYPLYSVNCKIPARSNPDFNPKALTFAGIPCNDFYPQCNSRGLFYFIEGESMSVNKVILIGRLGADPEVRYSGSGTAISNFRLATSRNYNDKSGQRVDETEWHRVVAFGRTAEVCGEYLHKGSQVYIEGRIQTREWEDKEGNRRWTTEIITERMQMLGSRGERNGAPPPAGDPFDKTPDNMPDDDVPF